MIDTNWFQGRIKDVKKSQRALAQVLGVDPAQVTNLLRGRRRMQLNEASAIAKFLNVQVEDVLQHAGLHIAGNSARIARLVGYVDEFGEVHIDGPQSDVEAPGQAPEGTIAVRLRTGELFMRGGLLFFKPSDAVDPAAIGRLSVCRIGEGPWLVRAIEPGLDAGTYDLRGTDGDIVVARLSHAVPVLWIKP